MILTHVQPLQDPTVGNKVVRFSSSLLIDTFDAASFTVGEEITLMDWGNCFVRRMDKGASGKVEEIGVELNLSGDFKATKKKVTWLAALTDLVPLTLVELDHVISKKKLDMADDVFKLINPDSWTETTAMGDQNLRNVKKGDILQINRKGYYICDKPFISKASPMTLIKVPDGKIKKEKKAGGAKA